MSVNANVKQSNDKYSMEGRYAYVQAVDALRNWEGFVKEVNEHGVVLTYEARGFQYVTLACWSVIASVDIREEIEGKPTKTDKPEAKPASGKPAPAAK